MRINNSEEKSNLQQWEQKKEPIDQHVWVQKLIKKHSYLKGNDKLFCLEKWQMSQQCDLFTCTSGASLFNKDNLAWEGCPKRKCHNWTSITRNWNLWKTRWSSKNWMSRMCSWTGLQQVEPSWFLSQTNHVPMNKVLDKTRGTKKNKATKSDPSYLSDRFEIKAEIWDT